MRSITFNGKNSIEDFDLYVNSLNISPPSKKQIRVSVPFLNGTYDFSKIYGENTFEDRTLKYTFDVVGKDSKQLNAIKMNIYSWLMSCGQNKLYDSSIPGYFFLAECTDISESDENEYSSLSATFIAYPFKIREDYEGDNLWDTFCFETDYLQNRTFEILSTDIIELYNSGVISVVPLIVTSSEMLITIENVEYTLNKGENKIASLKLRTGNNVISISGSGTIEFRFNSEVL